MDIRHLYIVVGFIGLPKRYKGTGTRLFCVRERKGQAYEYNGVAVYVGICGVEVRV